MRARSFVVIALLSATAITLAPARAADPDKDKVVTTLTGDDLIELIAAEGFRGAKVEKEAKDVHVVTVKMDGYNVLFLVDQKFGTMQAVFGVKDAKNASLRRVNEWNDSKKFFKAYIDKDGDPRFTYDLVFKHGVTPKTVREFVGIIPTGIKAFLKEVCE